MAKMPSHGRPTLCTPELTEKLAKALRLGMPQDCACQLVGIDDSTFYNWMEWGKEGREPYIDFFDTINKAEPEFVASNLDIIAKAAQQSWTASAWLLERRKAKDFARNQTKIMIAQQNVNNDESKMLTMINNIIDQVAQGKLSVEDAKQASAMIEAQRRVVETLQIKEKVERIEQQINSCETDRE